MTRADIVAGLHARLQQLADSPPVAWLGRDFQPQLGQTYLSPRMSSFTTTQVGEGPTGERQHDGTYTITVVAPAMEGESPALAALLKAIGDLFTRATYVPVGTAGQSIVLLGTTEQPAMIIADWIRVPVLVSFTANDR